MGVDDLPSSRALAQLKAEERGKTPDILRIAVTALAKLFSGDTSAAVDAFGLFHDAIAEERSEYLLGWVVEDLKSLDRKYEELSAVQQEYLTRDWLALLADADRKSRETIAKERIRRIAQIVVASIREPIPPRDQTEEATGIATQLSDEDVAVLRSVYDAAERYENQQAPALGVLKPPEVLEIPGERALSHFGKLQGFGLIIRVEDRAKHFGGAYPSGGGFFVLERGKAFLRAITALS